LPYLATNKPLSPVCFYSRELAQKVKHAIQTRTYDRIAVYCSSMAQYVEGPHGIPAILDMVDVDSDKWRQYASFAKLPFSLLYRREARCLGRYEDTLYNCFQDVLVTTDREADLVKERSNTVRVHTVPNGVDTRYFAPGERREHDHPIVTLVGDMGYFPNAEAALFFGRKVLPIIRKSFPEIQFFVVGRNPSREVRNLTVNEGVTVTGEVPDVRPFLRRTSVSVATLSIATGIQNKILEAMASELPVVATPRAVQGLCPKAAELVEVGSTTEEIAVKVIRLLENPDIARKIGVDGRRVVSSEYDWARSGRQFLDLIENAGHSQLSPQTVCS
jgi:sugar transferase (PEP-CTERM/EpsH1 system associated)